MKSALYFSLALLVVVQTQIVSYPTITRSDLTNILNLIDQLIFDQANIPSGLQIRKHCRAMFHDCTQGCDGSINIGNTENRGLESYTRLMRNLYRDNALFNTFMSKADFAVLCGRRALAHAIKDGAANSGTIPTLPQSFVVFNYGRHNTSLNWNDDDLEGPLPDGIDNWPSILSGVQTSLKGLVSEQELVALLGIHNIGAAVQNNSGQAGPWGATADRNRLTNGMYGFLMGLNRGRNFDLIQTGSASHANGANIEPNYQSPPPTFNKPQWTRVGANAQGRIMLNADMAVYHSFTADANGNVTGKFCNQWQNATLYDCSNTDPSYLPLSSNAQLSHNYATNQTLFYWDVIHAFVDMTSVPSENDSGSYSTVTSGWECVSEVDSVTGVTSHFLQCQGDVFLQGCAGHSQPVCPPA